MSCYLGSGLAPYIFSFRPLLYMTGDLNSAACMEGIIDWLGRIDSLDRVVYFVRLPAVPSRRGLSAVL